MTGTINRIIQEVGGSTLEVTLSDGRNVLYGYLGHLHYPERQDHRTVRPEAGLQDRPGGHGDQVAAIEVQQAVTSGSQLNGTVVYVSTERGNQYIYLRSLDSAGNEELITVHVDDDTKFLEWDGEP
jgi:hypothetical protein